MIDALTVIVMAKFPEPGRVKTRLLPDLSAEQAAGVHREMLLHVVQRAAALDPAELVICFDPPDAGASMAALLRPISARFLPQSTGDLGNRMAAARSAIGNPRSTFFIGVDSPDVPTDHLRQAARLCRQADVVPGPSRDGGYWCLGLSGDVDAGALLAGIDWSSGAEAQQTINAARRLGWSVALADEWDDVDRIEDLQRLLDRLEQSTDSRDAALRQRLQTIMKVPSHG